MHPRSDPIDVLILGAGPAGMACAMELHKAGRRFTIVEKDTQVGGLSKTYRFGEFLTDNGPHRFFSKNPYLYGFIGELLNEKWIKVERFTRFYVGGKFYRYPVEWRDALSNLGFKRALKTIADYGICRLTYSRREAANFEEHAVANFGRTLAEFNVLNYTQKIWGLPCSQLSVDWAEQRIRGLTFTSLLADAILNRRGPKTLVDEFHYPEQGTGQIYEAIAERISEQNTLLLANEPVHIKHDGDAVIEVALRDGRVFKPNRLVSSIPVTTLCQILDPPPPMEVMEALASLRFRSQVYLFITINKPSVGSDQWIYFPDSAVPFGRISEMRNFSSQMSPSGKTSLFIEFFCWEGDEVWNRSREDTLELSMVWLEKLGFIERHDVMEVHHLKEADIYPVYDLHYRRHLDTAKQYLDQLSNLIYIGRPGRFKYTNQDHSLEMGILAAKSIIDGVDYDIDGVGTDSSYFEQHQVPVEADA